METFRENTPLAITGTIRGSSKEKCFNKVGYKSLLNWRRHRDPSLLQNYY